MQTEAERPAGEDRSAAPGGGKCGARLEAAFDNLRAGRMAVVVTRQKGDLVAHLVLCARHATPEAVNFMAAHGRGVISLVIQQSDLDRLQLPMQQRGTGPTARAAPVSIEACSGVSTGISAADRARTIQVAASPESGPGDVVSPGHIFPLLAEPGGVFALPGAAEAAIDMCRLADFPGAAVICAILDDNGSEAGAERLEAIGTSSGLPIVTADELLDYRRRFDRQLECTREELVETEAGGQLRATVYRSTTGGFEALALVKCGAEPAERSPLWVGQGLSLREHLGRGVTPGGFRCALRKIDERGHGVLLVLGNASPDLLSRSLDPHEESKAITFSGWALVARVLTELGFDRLELLNACSRGGSTLRRFGLRAIAAQPAWVRGSG